MAHALAQQSYDYQDILETIVTEDDEPVDNLFSAKQQRLLARTLYASWTPQPNEEKPKQRRKFLADVNVGVFFALHEPPLVPDFFLSLDVQPHKNWYAKAHRSYFVWEFGKVPEAVIEIVSNRKGGELTGKLKDYARMGVTYYVVYDPEQQLSKDVLRVYEIGFGKRYRLREDNQLPELGLGLTLWRGVFEAQPDTWLRWCDATGKLIPTGEERAHTAETEVEKLRAELARLKRKPAKKRAAK
ncbi:MAG: Uma2 family endonuclease [Acidobacteria bacterium]|nr:Uma2 family endonuclease [Acidobacteriota bacterium]MBI3423542.1 Uma2 family endonuclease [Acidobacteriota bacterium]